jgi:hypothetical protein
LLECWLLVSAGIIFFKQIFAIGASAAAAAAAGHLTSIVRSMAVLQLPLPGRLWLRWQVCIGAQLQRLRSREVADVLTALAVARRGKVDPRCV